MLYFADMYKAPVKMIVIKFNSYFELNFSYKKVHTFSVLSLQNYTGNSLQQKLCVCVR